MTILSFLILLSLFILWHLEWITSLLNLNAFPNHPPKEIAGLMNQEKIDRARSYLSINSRFDFLKSSVSLGLLLVFWLSGGFTWFDSWTRSQAHHPILLGLLFIGIFFFAQNLIALPFQLYETFVIEEKFGFNQSTLSTFIIDQIKSLLLGTIIGLPLLAGILWIFTAIPNSWLWAWVFVSFFQLTFTYFAPTLILPLFNRFTPMADGELKEEIQKLGIKCGFPLEGIFVIDGSKRSTKANAYFTGFGKNKKIALFDTLIEKSTKQEILAILAHEIGHFRLGHIRQRLAVGILQMAVIFFLIGIATNPANPFAASLHQAFGVSIVSTHAGLIFFSILLEPVSKILSLIANAWSRKHEFEADAYAAQSTHQPEALISALKKLTSNHLSHPAPHKLRVLLDYSHPPLLERIQALGESAHS